MKYQKVYVGPTLAETIFNTFPNSNSIFWTGTEHLYLNPAIRRIDLDLGGENHYLSFVQEYDRDKASFGVFKASSVSKFSL